MASLPSGPGIRGAPTTNIDIKDPVPDWEPYPATDGAAAEQRAAKADQFRAEADAAAEEVSEHLAAAQARTTEAQTACTAAEADRDAAIGQVREDAAARLPLPRRSGTRRSSRHAPRPQPASAQRKLTGTGPASTLHRRKKAPG